MNVRYVLNPSQTLRLSRVNTDTKDTSSAYLQHIFQSITTPVTVLKNMTYNVLFAESTSSPDITHSLKTGLLTESSSLSVRKLSISPCPLYLF